jgi:hypothetical protein
MKLKLLDQGLIFLVFLTLIQCQNQEQNIEIEEKEFVKTGHNVLQNGRIISKPVSHLIFILMYISYCHQGCSTNTCRSSTNI